MSSSLPIPVGPTSSTVIESLLDGNGPPATPFPDDGHSLDHDLHLALYVLNELHYRGWIGVSDRLEWDERVTRERLRLGDEFYRRLDRDLCGEEDIDIVSEADRLLTLDGPSVSAFLRDRGTVDHVRQSMILRSPYQSKEADPHTFALPRFDGPVKRTFTEIQAGEYGVGHRYSHAELFAHALEGLDLDPTPNAHIDQCTGPALATSNLVTLGAMRRRWRGIVLGQLSLFEMDSVLPNQAMVECCDRLELDPRVRPFFHIHVMADTEHQTMVKHAFLIDFAEEHPEEVTHMLTGMRAQSTIDRAIADDCVSKWSVGRNACTRPMRLNEHRQIGLDASSRRHPAHSIATLRSA